MPAAITQVLKDGRYSVEQELSPRPNRTFFQAYDSELEAAVSIVAVGSDAATGRSVLSFEQLTGALARFKHTYVLGLRDSFVQAGVQYLVTDLIDGPDMATVMEDEKHSFPVPQVTFWGESMLEVLHGLHTFRPVTVFQSVRPEALIMRPDGDLSLLLSEMFEGDTAMLRTGTPASANRSIAYAPLEKLWGGLDAASQKVIIKTYDEASERALKQEMDARSDIFSVGATLYHLVTGRQPVDALERSIEMIDGNSDPLESPHKIDPSIPVEVSDVILKAMEIKREFRFDSAAIMRQVLRTAVVRAKERGEEISSPVGRPENVKVEAREPLETSSVVNRPASGDSNSRPEKAGPTGLNSNPQRASDSGSASLPNQSAKVHTSSAPVVSDTDAEDDLLGILTSTPPSMPEPASIAPNPVSDESSAAVEVTPAKRSLESETTDSAASPAAAVPADDPGPSIFSESEVPRSSNGIMFAAAAAVLVCVAGVGGWFYFGKTSAASVAPAVEQTVKPETQAPLPRAQPEPSAEQVVLSESNTSITETPAGETDINQPARAAAPAQRPKKQAAQSPKPAQKKAVTVDDLINDN